MNKNILKTLNIDLTEQKEKILKDYMEIFLEENSKVNLISKNDEKYLFEKHIFDSLAINLFIKDLNLNPQTKLLDIGTGGGFPAIPIAILFDDINIFPLDSIRKKINAIDNIKKSLNLKNVHTICDRVENINESFDIVTSRAVASLDKLIKLAATKINKNGFFIAYKSIKANEEILEAKDSLKKSNLKLINIINYELPLIENHERNLIVFKKL